MWNLPVDTDFDPKGKPRLRHHEEETLKGARFKRGNHYSGVISSYLANMDEFQQAACSPHCQLDNLGN